MKRQTDSRGSSAVSLAILMIALMMVSALFSEYYRIHALQAKVEAQLIQASNVALEASMNDHFRQDYTSSLDQSVAREVFLSYMRYDMGLDMSYRTEHCSLEELAMSFHEEPPYIAFRCTLRIPSMFTFFTSDMRVPMDIRSRNGRLD